jgi:hypothetical protein
MLEWKPLMSRLEFAVILDANIYYPSCSAYPCSKCGKTEGRLFELAAGTIAAMKNAGLLMEGDFDIGQKKSITAFSFCSEKCAEEFAWERHCLRRLKGANL